MSSPSSSRRQSTEPPQAESREEVLRRQLAARRKAKEQARSATPQSGSAPTAGPSVVGLSIKGKGRAAPSAEENTGGMRGWDEAREEVLDVVPRPGARSLSRAGSAESSLAYPRSPTPRKSRSPRRRYRGDRSPARDSSRSPRRSPSRSRDRSPPPPRWRQRDTHSPPLRPPRTVPRRSLSPIPRDRSPSPPPRRTFDNPDRLAMRQTHNLPPHPHQRYDPRRNNGPIQAEPMRGPGDMSRERRPSPSYKAYDRPPPPHLAGNAGPAAAESGGNVYGYGPGRRDLSMAPPLGQQGRGGWQNAPRRMNGPMDFEQRRMQREHSTIVAWPPSPKAPYKDEEEIEADRRATRKAKSKTKSKRSKHRSRYSSASSSESDSEDDRRTTRRKREKRRRYASSDSDSGDGVSGKRRRRRADVESGSESSEEEDRQRRKRQSKSKSKSRAKSLVLEGDEWPEVGRESEVPLSLEELARMQKKKKEEEEEIGPIMPHDTVRLEQRQRYQDMRPGEGEAMELYASNGMRIPRRGEIGINTERIQTLEGSGYVMSGARNKKMNAMRLRKENQVISAEEKRAILNLQREEKIKREGMIVSQFRELMNTSIQRQE